MARMNRIWKMYILFSFVVVLAMTVAGFVLQRQLKRSLYSHLEEDVLTLARALARALPATDKPLEYGSWCDDYGTATGVRITLIAEDGKVVCDSLEKGIVGAGRLDRPEVEEALRRGTATEVRFSGTSADTMLYVSLHVPEKGKIVRLSLPMKRLKGIENEVMAFLVVAIYLSPFLAVLIAFFFVKRLVVCPDRESAALRTGSPRMD